jgi:hypothetical protein
VELIVKFADWKTPAIMLPSGSNYRTNEKEAKAKAKAYSIDRAIGNRPFA